MDWQYYKRLLISITGIYAVYLNYGLVQERIYRYVSPDGTHFTYTSVLLLLQCAINFVIASAGILLNRQSPKPFSIQSPKNDLIGRRVVLRNRGKQEVCTIRDITVDGSMARIAFELDSGDVLEKMIRDSEDVTFVQDSLPDYAIYGVCYTLAMIFSNNSLKHVNYPTQVLAKSCKMIPVLVAGTLFGTRRYSIQKYISVFVMTAGIILFQLNSKSKKATATSNSTFGLVLLFLSLCMDGVCGMQQDVVVPRFKPSPLRLQQMLNVYGMGVSFIAALLRRELVPGVAFFLSNTRCLWLAIQFGVCSAVGQLFILYTVRHFPPLVLSTITTTRKFFSILLSVFFMGNSINFYQWCGVLLVFFGISYDKIQGGRKKTHGN
ncbi:hypothetical protein WA538_004501, partial [Blastocystis sp. DL]